MTARSARTTRLIVEQLSADGDLFRRVGEDTYRCVVCGADSETADDSGSTPSMMSGDDFYSRCSYCRTVITFDPFTGAAHVTLATTVSA